MRKSSSQKSLPFLKPVNVAVMPGIGIGECAVRQRQGPIFVKHLHDAVLRRLARKRENHILQFFGINVAGEKMPYASPL
jgi:hypothetical protein